MSESILISQLNIDCWVSFLGEVTNAGKKESVRQSTDHYITQQDRERAI